jgi:PKD repeat protein
MRKRAIHAGSGRRGALRSDPLVQAMERRVCLSAATFTASVNYALTQRPEFVAQADFNGDAVPDLVASSYNGSRLSILPGNADGTLGSAVHYNLARRPDHVATGDLNNDGRPDIIATSFDDNSVTVLLNQGGAVFASASHYAAGTGPRMVATGDFTGDGFLDLVVGKAFTKELTLLVNNGNGTFQAAQTTTLPITPVEFVTGDFDGDGHIDLASVDYTANRLAVHLGNGNGTFDAPSTYITGSGPSALVAADLDNDGDLDLAVANFISNSVSLRLNNGVGTFLTGGAIPAGSGPSAVTASDLNVDGLVDLVTANANGNTLGILTNAGGASFNLSSQTVGTSPRSVVVTNFNGGAPDLVSANEDASSISVLLGTSVVVTPTADIGGPYVVDEDGSIQLDASASTGLNLTYAWDLDGDGVFGETGAGATRGIETGATPTFSASGLNGPSTYAVALRISSSNGLTASAGATLTIVNVAPVVTLTGESSTLTDTLYAVSFARSDTSLDSILGWTLDWGDGTTSTLSTDATTASRVYGSPGTYTVRATLSDDDGLWPSNPITVVVSQTLPDPPVASAGGSYTVAEGDSIELTSLGSTGFDLTHRWDLDGDGIFGETGIGASFGDETGPTTTFLAAGLNGPAARVVAVRVTDPFGQTSSASASVSIINASPTVSISGGPTVTAGSAWTITLNHADPGPDAVSQWIVHWGDGTTSTLPGTATNATKTYPTAGEYQVYAVATDGDGNWSTASIFVNVQQVLPGAPVANPGSGYTVSEGGAIGLDGRNSTGSSITFAWDLDGDGVFGETGVGASRGNETGSTPAFSAAGLDGAGTFTVRLRVTDAFARVSTAVTSVAVTNVAPTITITAPTSVAVGQSATIQLTAADPGTDTVSRWRVRPGDGREFIVNAATANLSITYATTGNYTITVTATDEDGSYSRTQAITVLAVDPLPLISGAGLVNTGSIYTLTLQNAETRSASTNTISAWVINWGDGTTTSVAGSVTSVTKVWTSAGTRTVTAAAVTPVGNRNAQSLDVVAVPIDLAGPEPASARTLPRLTAGDVRAIYEHVGPYDRADFYRMRLDGPMDVTVQLRELTADVDLVVYDEAMNEISASRRRGAGNETINLSLPGGSYIVRVWSHDRVATDYRFRMATRQTAEDPGIDVAQSRGTLPIEGVRAVRQDLADDNRYQYHRFNVASASHLFVKLEELEDDADLAVLDASGTIVGESKRASLRTEILRFDVPAGEYFVRVSLAGWFGGGYRLRLATSAAELSGAIDNAVNLGRLQTDGFRRIGSTLEGGTQFFRFTLGDQSSLALRLLRLSDNADLHLLDSIGRTIESSARAGTRDEAIDRTLDAGIYYVAVSYAGTGAADYSLRLEI